MTVYDALKEYGTLTRERLARITGMSDRKVRYAIRDLRKMGIPIASDSEHCGYKISSDPSEIRRTAAELRHRGIDLLDTADAMEAGLSVDGQIVMGSWQIKRDVGRKK